jgi:tRNA A-37 threonylcarbamoyl transferase component Bud32
MKIQAQLNKECIISHYLNKNVLNDFFPYSAKYMSNNRLLTKYFEHKTLFEWEAYIYSQVSIIVPDVYDLDDKEMTYDLRNLSSIREILKENDVNFEKLCDGLFLFIETFKKYSFTHGNLKIDNIFIDKNGIFFVIDFTHSNVNLSIFNQCTDFHSLYNSILNVVSKDHVNYLDSVFQKHVPKMGY